MPTYDYKCNHCGHQFEAFQSMKEEPYKTCPNCNTENLKRLIGAGAGLIFKGSGFYLTDYKNNSGGKDSKSKPAEASKPKTETASTETKSTSSNTSSKGE